MSLGCGKSSSNLNWKIRDETLPPNYIHAQVYHTTTSGTKVHYDISNPTTQDRTSRTDGMLVPMFPSSLMRLWCAAFAINLSAVVLSNGSAICARALLFDWACVLPRATFGSPPSSTKCQRAQAALWIPHSAWPFVRSLPSIGLRCGTSWSRGRES